MQILKPGTLPMITGMKIIFLLLVLVVALGLVIYGIKWIRKGSLKKTAGMLFLISSISMFYFVISNFVNFGTEIRQLDNKYVGKYIEESSNAFLNLNENKTWQSNSSAFKCSDGKWDHIESEDFYFIELGCGDRSLSEIQIFDISDQHLRFQKKTNDPNITITISFIRVKN